MPAPIYTQAQALIILDRAIAEKKLTRSDINRYLVSTREEIATLESRLAILREAVPDSVKHPVRTAGRAAKQIAQGAKRARRKMKKASAEVMASRKLQGQYIAAIRTIPKSKRAQYASIAKEKGREAAIREIKKATASL